MNISLSDHFDYRKLMRFTMPSIVMMIFTSVYGIVDGYFVSNFVGKTPFAAVNFIMPFLMMLGAVGFMFGAGGSALIAKTMGEGKEEKAKSLFTLFVCITAVISIVITVLSFLFIRPIAVLMGAEGAMLDDCVLYGRILLLATPFFIFQFEFQSFFVAAAMPQLGLLVTVVSGVANMVLDALFIAVFHWGLEGAAAATAVSQFLGGIIPLIYFSRPNSSLLRFTKTEMDVKALLKACGNGSSELLSNVSMSLVSMLYNIQLMKYAGENGVAAYGVLMYVNLIFLSAFIGFSTGIAPVVGYHLGARNNAELRSLRKKSTVVIAISSIAMFIAAEALGRPLSYIFVGYDESLLNMTARAFMLYSFSFLFSGAAIFSSAFFTALNDGFTSAVISFLRTLVFQVAAVLLLPLIWGLDGIWISIVAAELVAAVLGIVFIAAKRKKFGY